MRDLFLCARVQIEGSYVLTSGDLASSAMVRRLVTNMMNSTLRKLEVGATLGLVSGGVRSFSVLFRV